MRGSRSASKLVAIVGSLTVLTLAAVVLAGWIFYLPRLTQVFSSGPTVKTNASIALLAAAAANLLFIFAGHHRVARVIGRLLGALTCIIGTLTLSEHVVGWDLGIDQVLRLEREGALATTSPNRMGPPASLTFALLGLAVMLTNIERDAAQRLRQWCVAVSLLVITLPTIGYAYGFSPLYLVARYTGIALTTSIAVAILAISILAVTPHRGVLGLLTRHDEAGQLARSLVPAAMLLPLAVGLLLSRALQAGIIDGPFAVSAMALTLLIGLTSLITRTGTQLARALDARQAAEHALADSERSLREADRQKTEFLATLSHELRNPLAPIRFAVELLDGPPAVAARARQTIARQVAHMVRLIEDLLDLTRITRNKLQLHRRHVEMRTVIDDAVDAVNQETREAGHTFTVDLPAHPIWVDADPDRLIQVMTNLLTNAIRYTPPGGHITLSVTAHDQDVAITVRDDGAGIAAGDLNRVFDMFVQVGEGHHTGLGIGLALVRGLVALHDGTVEAHSEGRGRGAEFRVRLPQVPAPPALVAPQKLPAQTVPPCRVLIVDDNQDAADMLGNVLKSQGHIVQVAYDGVEALRRAAEFGPDVGLLDIGMSPMTGHELAQHLRRDARTADTLLIAITGWGQEDDRQRALAAGFDAHLTKPADPDAVLALMARRGVAAP